MPYDTLGRRCNWLCIKVNAKLASEFFLKNST